MATQAVKVGGIILCGGKSRRMGRSKAWLEFGSEFLLQRMVRIVSGVVRPVIVAGRVGQSLPPLPQDVRTVHDTIDDGGPLAGVDAGFNAFGDSRDAVFVTSCDHPLLDPAVIERLIDWLGEHQAVVLSHEDRLYPLTAIYRLATHRRLTEMLNLGQLRAHDFARGCNPRIVPSSELLDIDPNLSSFRNINDPESYERMLGELAF
jgi:molybdopterin-guanine dinucleotide biosynthesis protein A